MGKCPQPIVSEDAVPSVEKPVLSKKNPPPKNGCPLPIQSQSQSTPVPTSVKKPLKL